MSREGLKLTKVGECCNPECRAPLFAELMIWSDDEACYRCAPPDDGARPPMVLLQGGQSVERM